MYGRPGAVSLYHGFHDRKEMRINSSIATVQIGIVMEFGQPMHYKIGRSIAFSLLWVLGKTEYAWMSAAILTSKFPKSISS